MIRDTLNMKKLPPHGGSFFYALYEVTKDLIIFVHQFFIIWQTTLYSPVWTGLRTNTKR